MAQSPLDNASGDHDSYLQNWNALSSMIVRGRSFSGFERHCAFLNVGSNPDGKLAPFANVSAATGFDLIDDGRALARVDWDRDGDLDFWTTNRQAPRLRLLKNNLPSGNAWSSVSVTLQGTQCNRDAIGAVLKLTIGSQTITRVLRAGEGFMAQSSKSVHFGLGKVTPNDIAQISVLWPGANTPESFPLVQPGRSYHLVQGTGTATPKNHSPAQLATASPETLPPTEQARLILSARSQAPALAYVDFDGNLQTFDPDNTGGKPTLINLWASWCAPCVAELKELAQHHAQLSAKNLNIIALTVEAVSEDTTRADIAPAKKFVHDSNFPFQVGATDADGLRQLSVLHNLTYVRERPLPLPASFLFDKHGNFAALYKGPVSAQQLLADIDLLEAAPAVVAQSAFPFPALDGLELFPIGELDFANAYQSGGYLADARRHIQRAIDAPSTGNPTLDNANRARAWYQLGALEQSAHQWQAAAQAFAESSKLAPGQPLLKVAQGAALALGGEHDQARQIFTQTLAAKPNDPNLLHAVGKAFLQSKLPQEAIAPLQQAYALVPKNLTLALALALAHEKSEDFPAALALYESLLQAHPNSAQVQNSLALLLTTCPDESLRKPERALSLAAAANTAANRSSATILHTLALTQADNNENKKALQSLDRALALARATGKQELQKTLRLKREEIAAKIKPPSEQD